MNILIQVVLPVFIVIGFGYLAAWSKLFSQSAVDALMQFTQSFAIPCLLFRAVSTLDLGQTFDLALLGSFYFGAFTGFALGLGGARFIFGRSWQDSVAIGFCCLFSNSVLLGLPLTERAFGVDALPGNFAIIALHAPLCYALGVTVMEVVKSNGKSLPAIGAQIAQALARNPLVIALACGFAVNLSGFALPMVAAEAFDLLARAGLPAALFALGGVLLRYRPEGDMRVILFVCAVSLVVHPALVWGAGSIMGLDQAQFRSAILTAAMAPGINVYIFANMYDSAKRVAATAVLFGTGLTILTASLWLMILP